MAHATEGVSESVEAVRFSFMKDEEVRRHSVVKITNPILLDSVVRPVPAGLYDPAMGPLDDHSPCKSCGQRSFHCPGHCGHIDLVTPVYNPLLFNMLHNLLQRTCFFCLHFRASRSEVEKRAAQLELIAKGDIVRAKSLDSISPSESIDPGDSDGSHVSCSTVHSAAETYNSEHSNQRWTSVQFIEAMAILNKFLKPRSAVCKNCNAKNPKISKPTFGWFHTIGLSDSHARANVIRGYKLGGERSDETEENLSPEVVNADEAEGDSFVDGTNVIEGSALKRHERNERERAPREFVKQKRFSSRPLLPSEVRDIVKLLWENEAQLCSFICDIQHERFDKFRNRAGYSMFFMESVLVPPIKFRPAAKAGDAVSEHPQTVLLGKVLQCNIALGNAYVNNTERSKIVSRWMDLQQSINVVFDSKTATGQGQRLLSSGICQLLEKKEGIFRQKMMGKRVNFACRSVISPDPYLAVNEIGVPPYFAVRLTYPERVTSWNVANLRDAIINGPEIHPGATHYVDKLSTVKLPPNKKMRISMSRKLPSSRGVVTQNGKNSDYEFEGKIVYRHLRDGDIVLVNRQPTLHKPSIMAHVVRVLKGEKTLRMHYANCNTYNADFDGDEMNVHLPQDEISRAEAYNIVNANHQYIVPTRGDTVRTLIQDHIVSAVLLTMKDTFLSHNQFNQLLYGSGVFAAGCSSSIGKRCQKISTVDSEALVQPVLPAIWKPKPLWTGKQVITALLNHLTRNCTPFTVEKDGKIPSSYFGSKADVQPSKDSRSDEDGEHMLLIRKNELVHGVIDKAQFGKYGLVHTVQELYGSDTAGILLSALSRLFTVFLQIHGFTCGVDDLLILPDHDKERKKELEGEDVGEEVHYDFFKFDQSTIGPMKLQLEIEKAIHNNGQSVIASLDLKMKNRLHDKTSNLNKDLLVKGLLKPFPKNCISLMTISGAKGSTVNFQQISSCLGQQELEGKRVPRMVSGKTLPCFPRWDFSARAGGFISDRFLSGLRPQEYYFHCMAGREGLVDTAVKTSRSGYLQRCLIKNLECLKVCYDYTVRDADGSIVQFAYGEDGVDVHQTSFISQFEALMENHAIIGQKYQHDLEFNNYIKELPEGLAKKAQNYIKELKGKKISLELKEPEDLLKLVRQKYISSLAHSGEPVGVIAAQSIGEPSTQMTICGEMASVTSSRFVSRNSWVATGSDPKLTFAENGMRNELMTRSGLRPLNKLDLLQLRTHGKARQLRRKASKTQTAARARQGVIKCESGMTVAFVSAEVGPWSKTGGLGDVLGGLPPALAANGHRVMTVSPRYDQYKDAWDTNVLVELKVGDSIETVRFFHCYKRGVDRVFVDHPIFLEKVWGKTGTKIYGPKTGTDFKDNQLRFSLLCQAALEAPRVLNLTSNEYFSGPYGEEVVFVANDWHTALLPCYLKSMYRSKGIYKNAKVAFCIHNIAYQGRFPFSDFKLLNLPEEFKGSFDFKDGYEKPVKGRKINWMKAGILESDRVLTVSPYYAQELVSGEDKGVELDNIIRLTGITGILNGMDTQEWNPSTDKYIDVNYDASTVMDAKAVLKEDLQAEVGLPIDRNIPVIGFIGRLEEQKGSDILVEAISEFIDEDVQIIILGTGKKPMEKQIEELEELYPDKARGVAKFNRSLAHKITAGVDFILIPSRFEPCGLIQLQAMPYGTIPIVASTGGLFDTVKEGFTGFQMGAFNVECETVDPADVKALATNVKRAIKTYGTPALTEMVQNCMAQDLSWKGPAKKWENILLSLEVAGSEPGIEGEEIAPLAKENVATP